LSGRDFNGDGQSGNVGTVLVRLTRPTFRAAFRVDASRLDELMALCNKHFGDPEWNHQQALTKLASKSGGRHTKNGIGQKKGRLF
jgi:hypothetical protein